MLKKLIKEGGIVAVVVGVVSFVAGVDIAPDDVDKVVTGIAVVAIYAPKIWDGVKARFSKDAK